MIAQTKDFSFVFTRSPLILRLNEPLLRSVANDNPSFSRYQYGTISSSISLERIII